MKVVYIAGKFRGKTAWDVAENVRAAERIGIDVARAGAMPLIPHANTANFDGTLTGQFWLDGTMELLRRCDAVIMVEGWSESQGAVAEREEALALGLAVFDANDYETLRTWLSLAPTPSPETGAPHVQPTAMPPGYIGSAGVATLAPAVTAAEPGKPPAKPTTPCSECGGVGCMFCGAPKPTTCGALANDGTACTRLPHPEFPDYHTDGTEYCWIGGTGHTPAVPAAEPGKPATCPRCDGTGIAVFGPGIMQPCPRGCPEARP